MTPFEKRLIRRGWVRVGLILPAGWAYYVKGSTVCRLAWDYDPPVRWFRHAPAWLLRAWSGGAA